MTETTETRVAVLEKIIQTHEKRICDMEEFHRDVVDRLDQKISQDTANQVQMERSLTRAVTSIEAMTASIQQVNATAAEAARVSVRHEAMLTAAVKICAGLAVIGSAAWAVITHFWGTI